MDFNFFTLTSQYSLLGGGAPRTETGSGKDIAINLGGVVDDDDVG